LFDDSAATRCAVLLIPECGADSYVSPVLCILPAL